MGSGSSVADLDQNPPPPPPPAPPPPPQLSSNVLCRYMLQPLPPLLIGVKSPLHKKSRSVPKRTTSHEMEGWTANIAEHWSLTSYWPMWVSVFYCSSCGRLIKGRNYLGGSGKFFLTAMLTYVAIKMAVVI